jgi:hypothetical protein
MQLPSKLSRMILQNQVRKNWFATLFALVLAGAVLFYWGNYTSGTELHDGHLIRIWGSPTEFMNSPVAFIKLQNGRTVYAWVRREIKLPPPGSRVKVRRNIFRFAGDSFEVVD